MVLEFRNKAAGYYLIRIISSSGALVYQKEITYTAANPYYAIQLPVTLAKGIYQVIIADVDFNKTQLKMMIDD